MFKDLLSSEIEKTVGKTIKPESFFLYLIAIAVAFLAENILIGLKEIAQEIALGNCQK